MISRVDLNSLCIAFLLICIAGLALYLFTATRYLVDLRADIERERRACATLRHELERERGEGVKLRRELRDVLEVIRSRARAGRLTE